MTRDQKVFLTEVDEGLGPAEPVVDAVVIGREAVGNTPQHGLRSGGHPEHYGRSSGCTT